MFSLSWEFSKPKKGNKNTTSRPSTSSFLFKHRSLDKVADLSPMFGHNPPQMVCYRCVSPGVGGLMKQAQPLRCPVRVYPDAPWDHGMRIIYLHISPLNVAKWPFFLKVHVGKKNPVLWSIWDRKNNQIMNHPTFPEVFVGFCWVTPKVWMFKMEILNLKKTTTGRVSVRHPNNN